MPIDLSKSPPDRRKTCYRKRCEICSSDGVNGGRENAGKGSFENKLYELVIPTLTGTGSVKVGGYILDCIGYCDDEFAKKLHCLEGENTAGHHTPLATMFGTGCIMQASIDLCCLFSPITRFAHTSACRPQNCSKDGSSGIPSPNWGGLDTDLMYPNFDDEPRSAESSSRCLRALMSKLGLGDPFPFPW